MPNGFTLAIAGEHAEQDKTFEDLSIGILLAIFLVLVMAVQFESLLHPLIIMASRPLRLRGNGREIQAPLARVVLGGLSTSTLVTLV